MKNKIILFTIINILLICLTLSAQVKNEGLIFSEVFLKDNDSDASWIEIYNPTQKSLTLESFRIWNIMTTNMLPKEINEKGGLEISPGEFIILCVDKAKLNLNKNIKIIEIKGINHFGRGGFFSLRTKGMKENGEDIIRYGNPEITSYLENKIGSFVVPFSNDGKSYSRPISKISGDQIQLNFVKTKPSPGLSNEKGEKMNNIKIIISFFIALLFCKVIIAQQTNFRALCVGVSTYPDPANNLPNDNRNDAIDMRAYLMNYQGWSGSNIEVKTDDQATSSNILSYISSMPNTRGTSELFFFSGHGWEDLSGLAPYTGTISGQNIMDAFGSNYDQYCCILMACHSGHFKYTMSKGNILMSCAEAEDSYDGGPNNHSIFTNYILEGLKNNQADPATGHVVSTGELFLYSEPLAKNYAYNTYRDHMHPQYLENLGIFNFQDSKTTSGTLIDDELWDHNVTLTGNVSVPTGDTLQILSSITINLGSYSIIFTGGIITLQNGATINGLNAKLTKEGTLQGLYGKVQSAVDAIPDYTPYQIDLSDGTISENISIVNKCLNINGGPNSTTLSGNISASNCDYLNLYGFTSSNHTISLSGCYYPNLYNVNIISGANQCLYAYNCEYLQISAGDISDRYAYTFGTGLFVNQSTASTIDGTLGFTFFNHNGRAILVSGSTLTLNNVYFCSNTYDFITNPGGYVNAYNCWFPGGNASTQGSGIFLSGNQNFTNCSGLYKAGGSVVNAPAGGTDSLSNEFGQINNADFDIASKIRADISAGKQFDKGKYRDGYLSLVNNYTGFINKHPSSGYSNTALTSIVHIYKALGDYDGMKTYLQSVLADNNLKTESGLAKRFMIDYYSGQKDFTTAIKTADEILAGKDTNYICDALYAKGYIYSHDLNNQDEAVKCFSDIINNHSYNSLVTLAENELQLLGVDAKKIAVNNTDVNNNSDICISNYPNPFNPSTTLSYVLPRTSDVDLEIYDILGNKIKSFMIHAQSAGKQGIVWNGTNSNNEQVASGIYLFHLKVRSLEGKNETFEKTTKLLLLK